MKTIVIGLGNPILGDDGVGWRVAEEVRNQLTSHPNTLLMEEGNHVDVDCLSLGGIGLMERLIGYEHVILIDAFFSAAEPGTILISGLGELPDDCASHITSAHDTSLQNAIKLGRELGAKLPENITVVGISTTHVYDFSEELSRPVAEAVQKAAQIVMELATQNIIIH